MRNSVIEREVIPTDVAAAYAGEGQTLECDSFETSPNQSNNPSRNHRSRRTLRAPHGLPEQQLPSTVRLEQHASNLRTDYRARSPRFWKRIPSLQGFHCKA